MDLHQSHFSAFTRFSDMLKDTTRRKHTSHSTRTPSITTLSSDAEVASIRSRDSDSHISIPSKDNINRRSSSISTFPDRVRQIFASSPHRLVTKISHLPVEVLQQIFLYLDLFSLLRTQRVCTHFRHLIPGDSPLLAELLYLKPSRNLQIYNLVPTTFDFEFDIIPRSIESGFQPDGTRFSVGVKKEFSMMRRCMGLIRTSQEIVFHPVVVNFNYYMGREGFRGGDAKEGSWRDMLVSMPPLRELNLKCGKWRKVFRVLRVGEEEDGVRLGELFDALNEWASQ